MVHEPLPPGSTIGILGGGQLGRFLAIAAAKLGLKAAIYSPDEDSPAFEVAARHFGAAYHDDAMLTRFAEACDVVTFEFENVPAETLRTVAAHAPVRPHPRAAEVAQDRIAEKRFLTSLGLAVAPHAVIGDGAMLEDAVSFLSGTGRGILKRAREGYDGKGQWRVASERELRAAFAAVRAPCVLEAALPFAAELSVIAVRGKSGELGCYDIPRSVHEGGILRRSIVPGGFGEAVQTEAVAIARAIASALDYVGVLAVELFLMPEGQTPRLVVNEIAPRVHNTGHWTLDACAVSQFENHVRAVCGWPLGSVERHSNAVMTNLLGGEVRDWRQILERNPSACLYLYGKAGIREGRKLGHVTEITLYAEK